MGKFTSSTLAFCSTVCSFPLSCSTEVSSAVIFLVSCTRSLLPSVRSACKAFTSISFSSSPFFASFRFSSHVRSLARASVSSFARDVCRSSLVVSLIFVCSTRLVILARGDAKSLVFSYCSCASSFAFCSRMSRRPDAASCRVLSCPSSNSRMLATPMLRLKELKVESSFSLIEFCTLLMPASRSASWGCTFFTSKAQWLACFFASSQALRSPATFSAVTFRSLSMYCSLVLSCAALVPSSEASSWSAPLRPLCVSSFPNSLRILSRLALSSAAACPSHRLPPPASRLAFPPVMVPALEMTPPSRDTALTFSLRRKQISRASSYVSHTTVFSTAYITAALYSGAKLITSRQSLQLADKDRSRSLTSLVLSPCKGMKDATPTRCSRMY
mmetsp:Transcript_50305/g.86157  ORF Transcript_50305/g.86157 Transcript_50305/m.86157 type:complete len:387 (+) Transcript_50305:1123-2283(+)